MKHPKDSKKRKLSKKIWDLICKICERRADYKCEACGYPLDLGSDRQAQRDHFITSMCAILRYDIHNISNVCNVCHTKKTYGQGSGGARIQDAVKKRGMDLYRETLLLADVTGFQWTIDRLERQLEIVEEQYKFKQEDSIPRLLIEEIEGILNEKREVSG